MHLVSMSGWRLEEREEENLRLERAENRKTTFHEHPRIVLILLLTLRRGGGEKKMLRPPSCGISHLIRTTSCSAAVLSGLC